MNAVSSLPTALSLDHEPAPPPVRLPHFTQQPRGKPLCQLHAIGQLIDRALEIPRDSHALPTPAIIYASHRVFRIATVFEIRVSEPRERLSAVK
jgi:hypothetical protein